MNDISKKINGVFTINVGGVEYPNLVVATGLSNIFRQNGIGSLCDTLKVYNQPEPVTFNDVGYGAAAASTANITAVDYGVSSDANGEYFYMKKTWTFAQGQIPGTISKLAVFSDDGSMYAAALLRNEAGELDPVRPLFAPKVDISYESKWHFEEDESYTAGTPVYFSEAGMITVKTNMANKNDPSSYQNMDQPLSITSVELFSDGITANNAAPTESLGVVDLVDYNVDYIDGRFGAYGQILHLVLPKDKYINNLPISSIVISTTRGHWQFGFEPSLEKPLLSKRRISLSIPFLHGIISETGDFTATGNPGAIDSIFSTLLSSTYNISTRTLTYNGVGTVDVERIEVVPGDPVAEPPTDDYIQTVVDVIPGYFGEVQQIDAPFSFVVPASQTIKLLLGNHSNLNDYFTVSLQGTMVDITANQILSGRVDDTEFEVPEVTFSAGDNVTINITPTSVLINNTSKATSYTTTSSLSAAQSTKLFIGSIDAIQTASFIVY